MKNTQELGDINNHTPKWLKWTTIKKKYPNKWLMLGYKEKGISETLKADVLGIADTSDEIIKFSQKNTLAFLQKGEYNGGFSVKNTITTKKKKKNILHPFST